MDELIKVSNLVKIYKKNAAVDNASFTIERGKIYGLLGPNGAPCMEGKESSLG